jgi:hypothetical protein
MRLFQIAAVALAFSSMSSAMAQERIRISSDWGNVTAELADNAAARSLIQMLPIAIDMRDHLRQEKRAICRRRCRRFLGSWISRWGPWDCGVRITW